MRSLYFRMAWQNLHGVAPLVPWCRDIKDRELLGTPDLLKQIGYSGYGGYCGYIYFQEKNIYAVLGY